TFVGDRLEVPLQLAGIDIERNDGARVQIVSGTSLWVKHMHRVAGPEVRQVRLRVVGRLRPHSAATGRGGARVDPGFRPRLARFGDHRKPPEKLAGIGRVRGDTAPTALAPACRSDQRLTLDPDWPGGLSRLGDAFDRRAD